MSDAGDVAEVPGLPRGGYVSESSPAANGKDRHRCVPSTNGASSRVVLVRQQADSMLSLLQVTGQCREMRTDLPYVSVVCSLLRNVWR